MDAGFVKLLRLFALSICAVFVARYIPILLYGNGNFAEDFAAHWRALAAFDSWPPASPYHAAADAEYFKGETASYHPFLNPPFFLFLLWPLKFLPYPAAIFVWYAAQFLLAAWVMNRKETRALWPEWAAQPNYLRNSLILSLPLIINTVLAGQIGLLLAAILVWGLALLKDKPLAAGAVFALLAVKPQLSPAVGILLLFGRHGRALLTYLTGVTALTILSVPVWGMSIWQEYNDALALHTQMMSLPQIPAAFQMQLISIYGGMKLLGLENNIAFLAQAAVSISVFVALAWRAWKTPLATSTLALAIVSAYLMSFYVLQYDAVAMAAILIFLLSTSLSIWGRLVIILTLASGIVVPVLQLSGVPAGALTLLFLWGLCLHLCQKSVS